MPITLFGQSPDQNYVKTVTYQKETVTSLLTASNVNPADAVVQINYFDGLGRPTQQVAHKMATSGKDIITHIEYDNLGRQAKEYLPFIRDAATMNFQDNAANGVMSFYASQNDLTLNPHFATTPTPFSEKQFENSPLNRVLKQAAPGEDWALGSGHEIKFDYAVNLAADNVRNLTATTAWETTTGKYDPTLNNLGVFAAAKLYKTITKDENWQPSSGKNHTTEEYTNQLGQVVLKRTFNANFPHDTYYVYDEYGNLTFVIPPKVKMTQAITETVLNELCYRYVYDHKNRLIEKKIPGKTWEFIVYDKLDRPVATGPALQPFSDNNNNMGWMITRYDVFSRPVITGWMATTSVNTSSRQILQNTLNGQTPAQINVTRSTSPTVINSFTTFYSQSAGAWPGTNYHVLSVNYFDTYNNLGLTMPTQVYDEDVLLNSQVKSLPTWSVTRILYGSGNVTTQKSYTLYDKKARPVYNYTTHEAGGYTAVETDLDFAGKVTQTRTRHKRTNTVDELVTNEVFSYAPQGQLISHIHQVGNDAPQQLSVPEYDALGQLIQKNVGGVVGGSPLQKVNYRYNIRGWMTQINDVNNLQDDLFAFKINYNVRDHQESTLLYNGNISATYWRTQTDNTKRHYNYQYDALNRLTSAHYGKNDILTHNYNESLGYDRNGNILYLSRYGINDYGDPIPIDDIFYNYGNDEKSNQLMRVTETPYGNAAQGFKDGTNTGDDYAYDDFGNMILDNNKGIQNIEYNHLNLPKKITFAGNNSITYIYNALGVKLRKEVVEADTQATTHYMGAFQYNNNNLQYIHTSEGYVRHTPPSNSVDGTLGAFDYVYNYTDHLGNIRLSYTLDPSDQVLKILEENHYYPFGMKHTYNTSRKDIRFDEAFLNPNLTPSENGNRRVEMVSNSGYQYKYNGKEYQDELGLAMYDYGARNYDPAIGRWMNIDPLAETSRRFNPYTYCLNNPVYFIDPDGMEATSSDVLTEADFDVSVDIGYGRKVSPGKISGAINYTADIKLSESGKEKFALAALKDAISDIIKNNINTTDQDGGKLKPVNLNSNDALKKLIENFAKYIYLRNTTGQSIYMEEFLEISESLKIDGYGDSRKEFRVENGIIEFIAFASKIKSEREIVGYKTVVEKKYSSSQKKIVNYFSITLLSNFRSNPGTNQPLTQRKLMILGTFDKNLYNNLVNQINNTVNNLSE